MFWEHQGVFFLLQQTSSLSGNCDFGKLNWWISKDSPIGRTNKQPIFIFIFLSPFPQPFHLQMRKKIAAGNAPFLLPNTLSKLATPKIYSDLFPSLRQNKITYLKLQEHPSNLPFWPRAGFPCPPFPGISSESEAELSTLPEQIWAASAHPKEVWEPALLIISIPSELEHPHQEMQHFNIKQQQGGKKREGDGRKKKKKEC